MTYLVDANILSEPTKPTPDLRVIAWLRTHERDIVVDPIVLGELRFGIALLPKSKKRSVLAAWFDRGVKRLECVPWDAETGLTWAELVARLRRNGLSMPIKDSLIAASALLHDLTIATRNVTDFKKTGARVVNPFDGR